MSFEDTNSKRHQIEIVKTQQFNNKLDGLITEYEGLVAEGKDRIEKLTEAQKQLSDDRSKLATEQVAFNSAKKKLIEDQEQLSRDRKAVNDKIKQAQFKLDEANERAKEAKDVEDAIVEELVQKRLATMFKNSKGS